MGQQLNKVIKRRRRKLYLKRRDERLKAEAALGNVKKKKPAKKTAKKKTVAKKAPVKKVEEPVAGEAPTSTDAPEGTTSE